VLIAPFGALSDRSRRKRLLTAAASRFLILSRPVMAMLKQGSTVAVFGGQLLVALLLALFSGPGPAALAELFPAKLRDSTRPNGYNFAVMAFGGTAPSVGHGSCGVHALRPGPARLPVVFAVITLAVVAAMRESAHCLLR
jgi:MHS family proline/betaine transporter-like MFS transporter